MAERGPAGHTRVTREAGVAPREAGAGGRDAGTGTVIWERVGRASRGPHPSLTHERIARAAIAIADDEGIESVSMRKVAARLRAGTMSLYRYVDGKDDLIDLMIDEVYGEAQCEPHSGNWRADLARIASDIRSVSLRHPWLANVLSHPARRTFS